MVWDVKRKRKIDQKIQKLPPGVQDIVDLLIEELRTLGPYRSNWPNYTKEKGGKKTIEQYHCHLKRGKPTYVACWRILDKKIKIMEVTYVGTHEKAPY